jgi:hypothetical protein
VTSRDGWRPLVTGDSGAASHRAHPPPIWSAGRSHAIQASGVAAVLVTLVLAARDQARAESPRGSATVKACSGEREPGGKPLVDVLLADHALFHLEADLRWIDLTSARLAELAAVVNPERAPMARRLHVRGQQDKRNTLRHCWHSRARPATGRLGSTSLRRWLSGLAPLLCAAAFASQRS